MKLLVILALLSVHIYQAHAQIITTVAGCNDTALGDGGPAVEASLICPQDVALDGKGNFYITDGCHNRIRKVDAAGIITTIAGTGVQGYNGDGIPATTAQIYRPVGIIFDHSGNLYFCDAYNNRVRKIDTSGIITTVAGNGSSSYNGDNISADSAALYDPHCIAFDAYGNMYITDFENHRIRKVNNHGIITTIAGTGVAGNTGDNDRADIAEINGPYGIIIDKANNIYFADYYENVVRRIDSSGIISIFAGGGTYISDSVSADSTMLNNPLGIAIDSSKNIYISEVSGMRVRKVISALGKITTIAGNGAEGFSGNGGPAVNAELNEPTGMAIDASGVVYFADFANGLIRRISSPEIVNQVTKNEEGLIIFPNPSYGSFTVNITSVISAQVNIIIFNSIGERLQDLIAITNIPTVIQLNQPNGIYILSAITSYGTLYKSISILK